MFHTGTFQIKLNKISLSTILCMELTDFIHQNKKLYLNLCIILKDMQNNYSRSLVLYRIFLCRVIFEKEILHTMLDSRELNDAWYMRLLPCVIVDVFVMLMNGYIWLNNNVSPIFISVLDSVCFETCIFENSSYHEFFIPLLWKHYAVILYAIP